MATYDEETKARALQLYLEHGAGHASQATGVPAGTIRSWASRTGQQTPRADRTAQARRDAAETAAERRLRIASRCYNDAEQLLDELFRPAELVKVVTLSGGKDAAGDVEVVRVDVDRPPPGDQRHIAVAAAILLDKAQLLSGEATARFGDAKLDLEKELEAFTAGAAAGHQQAKVPEGLAEPGPAL